MLEVCLSAKGLVIIINVTVHVGFAPFCAQDVIDLLDSYNTIITPIHTSSNM